MNFNHFTNNLTYDLILTIALLTAFAWCVRRGLLNPKEVLWLGFSLTFCVTSLVFQGALYKTRPYYEGNTERLLGMTALFVLPLVLAMIAGILILYRALVGRELAVVSVGGLTLRLIIGNVATLKYENPVDAIISPTNAQLRMGTGVAGALKSYGGASIERDALACAPLAVGQAIATKAGRLPASHIIHAVVMGPDLKTDAGKIKQALEGALRCARKNRVRRLAIPAFPGVGKIDAALVAPLTLEALLRAGKDIDEVFIVVPGRRLARSFQAEYAKMAEQAAASSLMP